MAGARFPQPSYGPEQVRRVGCREGPGQVPRPARAPVVGWRQAAGGRRGMGKTRTRDCPGPAEDRAMPMHGLGSACRRNSTDSPGFLLLARGVRWTLARIKGCSSAWWLRRLSRLGQAKRGQGKFAFETGNYYPENSCRRLPPCGWARIRDRFLGGQDVGMGRGSPAAMYRPAPCRAGYSWNLYRFLSCGKWF